VQAEAGACLLVTCSPAQSHALPCGLFDALISCRMSSQSWVMGECLTIPDAARTANSSATTSGCSNRRLYGQCSARQLEPLCTEHQVLCTEFRLLRRSSSTQNVYMFGRCMHSDCSLAQLHECLQRMRCTQCLFTLSSKLCLQELKDMVQPSPKK
jgi:hypothetical protein